MLIPSSLEPFVLDAEFAGLLLLEKVERRVAQDGKVVEVIVSTAPCCAAALIFTNRNVDHPVRQFLMCQW